MVHRPLIRALAAEMKKAADPQRAPAMQAYMKSTMPYLGIASPILKSIITPIFKARPIETAEEWRDTVLELWRKATHRETRYAALALSGLSKYKSFRTLDTLPMFEEMVVTGAWWDYVDEIAVRRLGELLKKYPREMK